MKDLSKILVPYDFSPLSQKALGSALLLAQLLKAELHVVHVEVLHGLPISESSVAADANHGELLRARIEEDNPYLKDIYKDVVIYYAVGSGVAPGPIILDYMEAHQMNLVMMGTHGRHGLKRLFLGSVAEEIVRHASCNVLTIPEDSQSFIEFDGFKRILVPIDFSGHAADALVFARKVASLSTATLDLAHVVHFPSVATITDAGVFSVVDYDVDVEAKAMEHLKAFYKRVAGDAESVDFTILQGPAADEIVRHATENNCDLIVIGTHGLSGLDRFLLGSVASKTIRRAQCPVLIVHAIAHKREKKAHPENEVKHS